MGQIGDERIYAAGFAIALLGWDSRLRGIDRFSEVRSESTRTKHHAKSRESNSNPIDFWETL